jgi:hypothetical protein
VFRAAIRLTFPSSAAHCTNHVFFKAGNFCGAPRLNARPETEIL